MRLCQVAKNFYSASNLHTSSPAAVDILTRDAPWLCAAKWRPRELILTETETECCVVRIPLSSSLARLVKFTYFYSCGRHPRTLPWLLKAISLLPLLSVFELFFPWRSSATYPWSEGSQRFDSELAACFTRTPEFALNSRIVDLSIHGSTEWFPRSELKALPTTLTALALYESDPFDISALSRFVGLEKLRVDHIVYDEADMLPQLKQLQARSVCFSDNWATSGHSRDKALLSKVELYGYSRSFPRRAFFLALGASLRFLDVSNVCLREQDCWERREEDVQLMLRDRPMCPVLETLRVRTWSRWSASSARSPGEKWAHSAMLAPQLRSLHIHCIDSMPRNLPPSFV